MCSNWRAGRFNENRPYQPEHAVQMLHGTDTTLEAVHVNASGAQLSRRLQGLQWHIAQTRRHYLLASPAQRQDPSAQRLHCQVTATGRF